MVKREELEKIKEDLRKVLIHCEGLDPDIDLNISTYYQKWLAAKADFIAAMDDNLIYEFPEPITFSLSDEEKHSRVESFIEDVSYYWSCPNLGEFIRNQQAGFFDNLTISDYTCDSGKVIKKGTKLIKSFKYFAEDLSTDVLNDIQSKASQIIQENKVEGRLCVSVHPLDYLSISETTYKWRSCHSLDGDYHAGNLSYMLDSTTVVCYLKGEKDEKLPNFPEDVLWNSKKWRVLLFFSNDRNLLFAGRQYPFTAPTALDTLLRQVLPTTNLLDQNTSTYSRYGRENVTEYWTNWQESKLDHYSGEDYSIMLSAMVPIGNQMVQLTDVIEDADLSLQYNDLLYSHCYKPKYSMKVRRNKYYSEDKLLTSWGTFNRTKVKVGAATPCIKCGSFNVEKGGNTALCEECFAEYSHHSDGYYYCDCCGNRVPIGDIIDTSDGEHVCSDCYDTFYHVCDVCGGVFHEDDVFYNPTLRLYLCRDCRDCQEDEE